MPSFNVSGRFWPRELEAGKEARLGSVVRPGEGQALVRWIGAVPRTLSQEDVSASREDILLSESCVTPGSPRKGKLESYNGSQCFKFSNTEFGEKH